MLPPRFELDFERDGPVHYQCPGAVTACIFGTMDESNPGWRCECGAYFNQAGSRAERASGHSLESIRRVAAGLEAKPKKKRPPAAVVRPPAPALNLAAPASDLVDYPAHYTIGIEPFDIIDSWGLGYYEGTALEYILRAPHKGNEVLDLKKAVAHLQRRIAQLEKAEESGE